ncbi:serine hydrolase [Solimonas sp. K1W22B-7]|uniref:serine hydrolase n=1 Tax=Solimonas sp. K1W22B-7 TaxID=2303331 RepID=UPI000E332814|nr:serine hydrolase [Solimonas sp. K1W22B-7]AXQ30032.1 serine hydrolase [Solimonas sp. K1W22B-7]
MSEDPGFGALFQAAGVDGWLHALDLADGREIGYHADEPVVAASVFKIPVMVELCRQADAGQIDLSEPVSVPLAGRAPGPTGLSMGLDATTLSWRDLALSMIVVSDNAATDVLCLRLGIDRINATMAGLGLAGTRLEGDCRFLFAQMAEDAGSTVLAGFPPKPGPELLRRLRALQPLQTNRTTPREASRLLAAIWRNEAASGDGCALMRRILGAQVWPHRLASGFPEDGIRTAGKTGTLVKVRNEAGVVSYPDGRHYAVSVFTRSHDVQAKHPAQDRAIGQAARRAVELLRS